MRVNAQSEGVVSEVSWRALFDDGTQLLCAPSLDLPAVGRPRENDGDEERSLDFTSDERKQEPSQICYTSIRISEVEETQHYVAEVVKNMEYAEGRCH